MNPVRRNSHRCLTPALYATVVTVWLLGGCAQSQSSGWAQTAPVIPPTSRASDDVLLGATAEASQRELQAPPSARQ